MSEDFVKFLIQRCLQKGSVYRVIRTNDWEDREEVESIASIKTVKISRLEEMSMAEPGVQKLIAITAFDKDGVEYGGHFISDWDDILKEYAVQFVFTKDGEDFTRITS